MKGPETDEAGHRKSVPSPTEISSNTRSRGGLASFCVSSGDQDGDSVSQSLSEVSITEGQDALLHCDFSTTSSTPYLFWYHQFPNHPPGHILTKHKYLPDEPDGKYSGTLNSEGNAVTLKIWEVSPADEAVYYCALSPTVAPEGMVSSSKTQRGLEMDH
uniref:Ig-like domain-containing protein n=1 Tax=Anolis carolinensis TaxID=28377 RepID=A0A803T3F6_ANOCA